MSKRISTPSAHDVARVARVSQAAVSRAFTPGASIADNTRAKVLRAAKTLGYSPNLLARSLIKGESGIIGVIIGNATNAISMSALDTLSAHMSRAGKHLLVFTADGSSTADAQVEDLLKFRVDAVVLMAASLSAGLSEQCRERKIPLISFNRSSRKTKGFVSVKGNNREGGWRIAEHLVQQGYRRFGFVAGSAKSTTGEEREAGFNDYLVSQGISAPMKDIGHGRREGATLAARNLLSKKQRPDAIFCANDYMALAAMDVARYEFGLEIGREIGIAGFDDVDEASWPCFELTTFSLPIDAMIKNVVARLLGTLENPLEAHTVIDGQLKIRRSTQRKKN